MKDPPTTDTLYTMLTLYSNSYAEHKLVFYNGR